MAATSGSAGILVDVVALVRAGDPVHTAKAALQARLERSGAKVVQRLGKEVTHIIYERRHSQRPKDKAADDADLLDLYKKLDKFDFPPSIVSPLWLEESLNAGRRLVEKRYLVGRPKESLLGGPAGAPGSAGGKKRRRASQALPKPADAYELDLLEFSSTQQIVNHNSGASAGAGGREASGSRGSKRGRGASGRGRGRGGAAAHRQPAVPLPVVQEQEGSEGEGAEAAAQAPSSSRPAVGAAGSATQAVANILTVDLPEEVVLGEGERGSDDDELSTPLSVRLARGSMDRSKLLSSGRGKWSDDPPAAPPEVAEAGAAAAGAAGTSGRSRLARVSGPHADPEAVLPEAEPMEEAAGTCDAEPMDEDTPLGAQQLQTHEPPLQQPELHQQDEDSAGGEHQDQQAQQEAAAAAAAAAEEEQRRRQGVAARFSTRQLTRNLDKPLPLKTTPLPGAEAPPTEEVKKGPIPVPLVERVVSPWTAAAALPDASQPSQQQQQQQQQSQPRPVRSLLGPGGNSSTPGDAVVAALRPQGKLPTPWSTLRPWDKQARHQQAGATVVPRENGSPASAVENLAQQQQQQQQQAAVEQPAPADPAEVEAAVPTAVVAAGPTRRCLAVTSCDAGIAELARSVTSRLRGMRLAPEGREDGILTHLVIGGERRTLKLMLAVAAGAWLVDPTWLTASLDAGEWLPEAPYVAKVRFAAAAERARAVQQAQGAEGDGPGPLLAAEAVYVHLADKARKLMGSNAAALKRVAAALGARLVAAKACTLCVVVGGGKRPPNLPSAAACVREEWLLLAAESYQRPELAEYELKE